MMFEVLNFTKPSKESFFQAEPFVKKSNPIVQLFISFGFNFSSIYLSYNSIIKLFVHRFTNQIQWFDYFNFKSNLFG